MSYAVLAEEKRWWAPWWLVLLWGILAIIMGTLFFVQPTASAGILIQFLGIYWLVTGVISVVSIIWDQSGWGWKLFNGVLGVLAGVLIIENPLWSTLLVPATLAILVGIIGIVIGILQLTSALRGGGWGAGILGALSILLAFLLITRPVIAGLALPVVLGGLLVFGGILAIIASFGLRTIERQIEESMARVASATGAAADPVQSTAESSAPAPEAADLTATSVDTAKDSGDTLDSVPEQVSEVVLTGNVDPNDSEEMAKFKYSLEYVEGIGPVYAGRLKAIGLMTCLDLYNAGATRMGRQGIAEKADISGKLILEWVNHVDLYRIKGVGSEYADLLEEAGVDTVVELAQRNPGNLYEKMNEVNAEKELVRKLPTEAQVANWVTQAKELPRVVTY